MGVSVYSLINANSLLGESKNRKNLYLWGIEGLFFLVIGILGCVSTQTGLRIQIQKEIPLFSIMFFAIGIILLIVGCQQRNENCECEIKEYDYVVQATVERIAKDSWYRRNYGNWVHLVLIYHGYDAMGKTCDYKLILEKLKNKKKYPIGSLYEVYFSRDKKIIYDKEDVQFKKSLERRYFLLGTLCILLSLVNV